MIKRILLFLLVLILVLALSAYLWAKLKTPKYDGNLDVLELQETVDVHFDQYGIPHIYAQNNLDAQKALGYLHAQERLWQMELMRRIVPGRLSEILGEVTIPTDRLFQSLSTEEYTKTSVEDFENSADPEMKSLVLAYLDGVNAFVETGFTPIEFSILGIEKEKFSVKDIFSIMSYTAFSFAMAHKTDPLVSDLQSKLSPSYLQDLDIEPDSTRTLIESTPSTVPMSELSIGIRDALDGLPVPEWIGSNSWVLGPSKTATGKPILANDPHMAYAQPGVWYEAHIHTPEHEIYGYFLACYPFPHLGHNEDLAVGITMLENDDIDFIEFEINPKDYMEYKYDGEWRRFDIENKKIIVKDAPDVDYEQKVTPYGPVVNDGIEQISDSAPIGMWWSYVHAPNQLLEASYKLQKAKSMEQAKEGAAMIHAPGLNVMYADKDDNIAWWAAAKLVKRPDSIHPKMIYKGDAAIHKQYGFYPNGDNPQAVNPACGYVYSANNQPISSSGQLFAGYYLPEDRARRIKHLLDQRDDWSVGYVEQMMTDATSLNAVEITNLLSSQVNRMALADDEKEILKVFRQWDGHFDKNGFEAVVYNKWLYEFYQNTFADELGPVVAKQFNGTHLMKRSLQLILNNPDSRWWDDLTTNELETSVAIITKSYQLAIAKIKKQLGPNYQEWQWGDMHTLTHNHTLGAIETLADYFNIGPFGVSGNNEVINNFLFALDDDGAYEVFAGPSTRRIIDFADVRSNSWSILPTGQSGVPSSAHYGDQAQMFALGKFRKQLMHKDSILAKASSTLVFE